MRRDHAKMAMKAPSRESEERRQILQRGTETLIRALIDRIEALSPGEKLATAQPAIEWLLNTAKERDCKSVYGDIERTLVAIVQESEGAQASNVPMELAVARTRIRALLDRIEALTSTACAPGSRDAVEVVADDEKVCVRLGIALMDIVQELEANAK